MAFAFFPPFSYENSSNYLVGNLSEYNNLTISLKLTLELTNLTCMAAIISFLWT